MPQNDSRVVYTNYSQDSGLSGIGTLGEMLAEPLVGTSQKFIPRTIREIVDGIKKVGGTVNFVDSFPKPKAKPKAVSKKQ